jgi:hypothetical protein
MPAVFVGADRLSLDAQGETKRLVSIELRLAIVATLSGLASWRVGAADLDLLALVGTIAFAVVFGLTLYRAQRHPEETWYLGRAQAESVKTLSWRFAVGGDPFPVTLSSADAEAALLDRFQAVVDFVGERGLRAVPEGSRQLPASLRNARTGGFLERKDLYLVGRLRDQSGWYERSSAAAGKRATQWTWAAGVAAACGFVAGLVRFFGPWDLDMLGLAAAAFGSTSAWIQLNQFRTLETSYAVAQQELLIIIERLESVSEDKWALFVSDAEDAISREHSMWLARRGHPGRGRPER